MSRADSGIRLQARSVGFSYRRPVLTDFSLSLEAGVVTGIIGPNGCGKTTALRVLDGILLPLRGEVLLDGATPLSSLPRREIARHIAVVPQSAGVYPYPTVFQFAIQGRSPHLSLLGFETERDERITVESLAMTRLLEHRDARVAEISGGERQRLLLARALAQQSRILLLDEFTANLDINYQVELMRLVRRITRERDLATLVVSHEIHLLAAFSDRIVLMSGGRIRNQGPVREVVTEENLRELFGLHFQVRPHESGAPEVVPVMKP